MICVFRTRNPLISSHHVFVCVCVRERERERESAQERRYRKRKKEESIPSLVNTTMHKRMSSGFRQFRI